MPAARREGADETTELRPANRTNIVERGDAVDCKPVRNTQGNLGRNIADGSR